MIAALRKWFGRDQQARPTYETALASLDAQDVATRTNLAGRNDTKPEMLYHLASDQNPAVRLKIAANPATPMQAARLLAQDPDGDVRAELAKKIGRLLPGLDAPERERLRDLTIEVLEKLAGDQLTRVRALLAEEIKSSRTIPAAIIQRLARDVELAVAAPILEYSPLLGDSDLLEIIAHGAISGALPAIARRQDLSAKVSDAVVATLDVPAIAALLANKSAKIRDETMDQIVEHAESIQEWHGPIVVRADLSVRAIRRVAGFVASSLVRQLQERRGLDDETAAFLAKRIRERLAEEQDLQIKKDAGEAVRRALQTGALDDNFILSAIENKDRTSVIHAIAALIKRPPPVVEKILDAQSARAVVALCWYAGLSMRTALKVQAGAARVAQKDIIPARNGLDYPLTDDEMHWQLDLFGITSR